MHALPRPSPKKKERLSLKIPYLHLYITILMLMTGSVEVYRIFNDIQVVVSPRTYVSCAACIVVTCSSVLMILSRPTSYLATAKAM